MLCCGDPSHPIALHITRRAQTRRCRFLRLSGVGPVYTERLICRSTTIGWFALLTLRPSGCGLKHPKDGAVVLSLASSQGSPDLVCRSELDLHHLVLFAVGERVDLFDLGFGDLLQAARGSL